jgi:hypothetical protein
MSTTGLWIFTSIEAVCIIGIGVFGWMASQGLTRIVVKTGKELGDKIAEVSDEIPKIVENVIEKSGDAMTANVAGAATNMATNQVSNLTDKVKDESAGVEMMSKMPVVAQGEGTSLATETLENAAGSVPLNKRGGGKQTKGNKPKKIRKPRTKKNIKKVGNQMYMNFSL